MILEFDVRQRREQHLILRSGRAIEVDVACVMRELVRDYRNPRFVRFVMTPEEWNRVRHETTQPDIVYDRFMGVPVSIVEEDPPERFLVEPWYDEWTRHLAIDPARPGSERTVIYPGGRGGGRTYAARIAEQCLNHLAAEPIRITHEMVEQAMQAMRAAPIRDPTADQDYYVARRWLADAADDVYRRHGGTKRPPSKLHPLVQLDEAIGRDMTKGDSDGEAR